MKNIFKHIIPILFILLTVASCKIAFIGGRKNQNMRPVKLYSELLDNELEYDNLSLKFTAEIKIEDQTQSFKGLVRIEKDSAIWLSLRMYNIEGARCLITKDTVKYLNRIEKQYYIGDIGFLKNKFDLELEYEMIQSILTNTFFFYPGLEEAEDEVKKISRFKNCIDTSYYCMSSISSRKYKRYYINDRKDRKWEKKLEKAKRDTSIYDDDKLFSKSNIYIIQSVKVIPELFRVYDMNLDNYIKQQFLYIKYDKQYLVDNQYFPHEIFAELNTPKFRMELEIKIDNIKINKERISFPFKISDKYTKIKL